MNLTWLILPVIATIVLIYLYPRVPEPGNWILIAIVAIVWLVILLNSAGVGFHTT